MDDQTPALRGVFNLQEYLLKNFEQTEPPVIHHFGPRVYLREIVMPAGELIVGARHKTEHFNIVLSGEADVLVDPDTGKWDRIKGPCVFISKAGVKKVLVIRETMRWLTIHPLEEDETDTDKLEDQLLMENLRILREKREALA